MFGGETIEITNEGHDEYGATGRTEPRSPAALLSERFVRVPAWFTAGAALQIAKLKHAARILVEARSQIVGFVDVGRLETSAPNVLVSRLAVPV